MQDLSRHTLALIRKELLIEWRNRYAINGILLYVASCVLVCYLSFRRIDPIAWNALFWVILLFAATNAVAKSFLLERKERFLYYYQLTSPAAIILSKVIYNGLLMVVISLICLGFYTVVMRNPVQDPGLYVLACVLGGISFSSVLTMVSAIASKASGSAALVSILAFPILVPLLLMLIKLSKNALDGLDTSVSMDEVGVIMGLDSIVVILSLLLFPYLWKD